MNLEEEISKILGACASWQHEDCPNNCLFKILTLIKKHERELIGEIREELKDEYPGDPEGAWGAGYICGYDEYREGVIELLEAKLKEVEK